MYKFGTQSERVLSTCSVPIQKTLRLALSRGLIDIAVIEGFRDRARQNRLFKTNRSRVEWPKGKHNRLPSEAVDAPPFVNGKVSYNWNHCIFLAGVICSCAVELGYACRWGGNWDADGEPITDQDFQDLAHYEITEQKGV